METKQNKLLMTVIVIAHRMSTVRAADRIIVMDAGSLDSSGDPNYLMKHSEMYNRIANSKTECAKRSVEDSTASDTFNDLEEETKEAEGELSD